jgi:hypothetical protein
LKQTRARIASRAKKTPDRRGPKQIAELGELAELAELAELRRQIPTDCGQLK